ncbi:MAG: MFS transporter [Chloroflexi bacterium]|nr:MAG: MFS transporter [Chloroflexota bacterium]
MAGLGRDFTRLWAGQSVSLAGSQVTVLALPLTAILLLHARPEQMGLLSALQFAPYPLLGLPAGVWVDRLSRRGVMIATNLGRALVLSTIPAAALTGRLQLAQLYLVAFVAGCLAVFFDVAYQSYLPSLLARASLVEGNRRLEISRSLAYALGPALGGFLVQAAGGPGAIAFNVATFLLGVGLLLRIRRTEPVEGAGSGRGVLRDLGEGVAFVGRHPLLRALALCGGVSNLFLFMQTAVLLLYFSRELHLSPAVIGAVQTMVGVGSVLGAIAAGRLARALGLGRTVIGAQAVIGLGCGLLPLAGGPRLLQTTLLGTGNVLQGIATPVYNVNQVSLRQLVTPDRMLGRVQGTMRTVIWGAIPVGAWLGGQLGSEIGLRPTLFFGAGGVLLSTAFLLASPLRRLKTLPPPLREDGAVA